MSTSTQAIWHGGGTCAPVERQRSAPPPHIGGDETSQSVPQRATSDSNEARKYLVKYHYFAELECSGTQWHDGLLSAIRDLRRAR